MKRGGIPISSSSEKTPVAVLKISASFLTGGIVLREGAFQRLAIVPYRTSSVAIAGSFSSAEIQQQVESIVASAIPVTPAALTLALDQPAPWGAFIGDPSHAEALFASYTKAAKGSFASSAEVAKATHFGTISVESPAPYPSPEPMGTAELREFFQKTDVVRCATVIIFWAWPRLSKSKRQPRCLSGGP